MKEQELQKGKPEQLPEDKEVMIKRVQLTEDAHKVERDRSNQLEDVSTLYNYTQQQLPLIV